MRFDSELSSSGTISRRTWPRLKKNLVGVPATLATNYHVLGSTYVRARDATDKSHPVSSGWKIRGRAGKIYGTGSPGPIGVYIQRQIRNMTGVQGDQNVSRSPHEFQFINIGNAANLEDSSKARIRAHAMRDFHRRKLKQEISGQDDAHAPSGNSAAPDIHQQSHKFRLGPWGLQQRPFRARASRQKRLVSSLPSQRENVPETGVLQQLDSSVNSQIRQLHPLSSILEGPGRRPTDDKAPSPVQTQLPETEQSVRQILTAGDEDDAALLENWEEDDDFFEMQTLQIGLGAGSGDPFGTIPYLNSQPLQNLLHYSELP